MQMVIDKDDRSSTKPSRCLIIKNATSNWNIYRQHNVIVSYIKNSSFLSCVYVTLTAKQYKTDEVDLILQYVKFLFLFLFFFTNLLLSSFIDIVLFIFSSFLPLYLVCTSRKKCRQLRHPYVQISGRFPGDVLLVLTSVQIPWASRKILIATCLYISLFPLKVFFILFLFLVTIILSIVNINAKIDQEL